MDTEPAAARTAAASRPPMARATPAAALATRQATRAVMSSGVTVRCRSPTPTPTPWPATQIAPAAATTAPTEPSRPASHHARIVSTRIGV